MNELLDDLSPEDGAVIARVRAALDEVTAHDHDHDHDQAHGVVPVELQRSGIGAGRWFAIAAAAVLVVGAVTAIAVNRSNSTDVASTPFFTRTFSNAVPSAIDWPTIRCCQPTMAPLVSSPALIVCR